MFILGETVWLVSKKKDDNGHLVSAAVMLQVREQRISRTDRMKYEYRLCHLQSTKQRNSQPLNRNAALLAETSKQLDTMRHIESLSEGERKQAQEVEDARQKQWQEDFERMKQEEDSQVYYIEGSDNGWFPESKIRPYQA